MLVLSRKASEKIQIGDNITVTILKIRGNTMQLGIDAPAEVAIRRSELLERTATQKSSSTLDEPEPVYPSEPSDKKGPTNLKLLTA